MALVWFDLHIQDYLGLEQAVMVMWTLMPLAILVHVQDLR